MKRKRINVLYIIIVMIIFLTVVYSVNNTKRFDLKFPVYKENSDVQIDNVILSGTLIRFSQNLYYINGYLTIRDNTYELGNYRSSSFNPTSKVNTYKLDLIDTGNEGYIHGEILLNGDIIQGDLINITISMDFMDETTGFSYSQVINTLPIQD